MSDIFEEVEEEVRKDRAAELWAKYGLFVWLAGALIVGAVAFNEWNTSRIAQARAAQMESFEDARAALTAGDYVTAQATFDEISQSDTRLAPLAAHFLAQTRLEGGGDIDGAISALQRVADANGQAYQQLALLKVVYLRSETMTLDEMDIALAPLIATETPMGALAEEALAAKAYAVGDFARARTAFNRLRFAANAPPALVQRATVALNAIPRVAPESEVVPEDTDTQGDAVDDAAGGLQNEETQ